MGQVIVYIAFTNMENGKIKEFQKEDAVGAVTVGPSSCREQGTSKAEPSPLIPDKPGTHFYPAADAPTTVCSTVGHGFYTSINFHHIHPIPLLRMRSLPHYLPHFHTKILGMTPHCRATIDTKVHMRVDTHGC